MLGDVTTYLMEAFPCESVLQGLGNSQQPPSSDSSIRGRGGHALISQTEKEEARAQTVQHHESASASKPDVQVDGVLDSPSTDSPSTTGAMDVEPSVISLQKSPEDWQRKSKELENQLKRYQRHNHDREIRIQGMQNQIFQKDHEANLYRESLQKLKATNEDLAEQRKELEQVIQELERQLAEDSTDSGSYEERAATPALLNNSVQVVKTSVTKFSKLLSNRLKEKGYKIDDLVPSIYPEAYFARTSHVTFAVKALVYRCLFEGFETESFMTVDSGSVYPDPSIRIVKFFECYQQLSTNSWEADKDFEDFFGRNLCSLRENVMMGLKTKSWSQQLPDMLQELGGEELCASFRDVTRKVWGLHKLCFSFEPPASILRVRRYSDVNQKFMEPLVDSEDDEIFVQKVGFMIAPGFRVRKTLIKCDVYLAPSFTSEPPNLSDGSCGL